MIKMAKNKAYKLIKQSERWTKTDMLYLVTGGTWLTLGKVVGALSGFFLALVYANFLPKEEYATYKYLLSILSILSIISLPGLDTALIRAIARGKEASLWPAIDEKLKWSLLASLLALIGSGYYFFQANHTLAVGLLIISISLPLSARYNVNPILQGKKLWKMSASLNSLKSVLVAGAIIITTWFFPKGLALLFASLFATAGIQYFYFKSLEKKIDKDSPTDESCLSLGRHLSAMSALGTIAEHLDKLLIWKFLGASEMAIYSFATVPINQFRDFLRSGAILAFPKIVQQDNDILKKTLLPKLFRLGLLLIIPTTIFILLAPFLFNLFFPQYIESAKYSQLLALSWLLFPQRILSHTLINEQKKKYLYFIQLFEPSLKIILYLTLIPLFSINGAIYSILVSSTISSLIMIRIFLK
jgi:O-antigen/teichoic acid export membrane protein